MNKSLLIAIGMSVLLWAPGCSPGDPPPKALTPAEVPAEMKRVFGAAGPDVTGLADRAVQSFQAKNYPKAVMELQQLLAIEALTKEQRRVASQSLLTVNESLKLAEQQGDADAAKFRQFRESVK